jgi:hypothetical protein
MVICFTTIYFFNLIYRNFTVYGRKPEMALLDLIPQEARERIERKGTDRIMVSAFRNLAFELLELQKMESSSSEESEDSNNKGVPQTVVLKGTGKI